MSNRVELHEKLCELLGTRNVYYQPPESIRMIYPCILYKPTVLNIKKADNKVYSMVSGYSLTYITKEADDVLYHELINKFEMCSFDRYYRADGLHHYTLQLFY